MNLNELEGIIVNTFAYADADLVVRVITTEQGKVSFIAKHARKSKKRFSSSMDIFQSGKFSFKAQNSHSDLISIQNFTNTNSYRKIRENLEKIACASLICEAADCLMPVGQLDLKSHQAYYKALRLSLEAIDQSQNVKETLKACYLGLAGLLSETGFLDQNTVKSPSAKALVQLINQAQKCSEREFKSVAAILGVIRGIS